MVYYDSYIQVACVPAKEDTTSIHNSTMAFPQVIFGEVDSLKNIYSVVL